MTIINPYGYNAPNPSVEIRVLNDTAMAPLTSVVPDPKWISLIPVFSPKGETNKAKLYRSGEGAKLTRDYGAPNFIRDGVAMDMAQMILGHKDTGVLLVNLRGSDATSAVAFLTAKYKVRPNVQKVNDSNQPLYLTPEGVVTTVSTGNTAIMIDEVTLKYEISTTTGVTDKKSAKTALDLLYNNTADGNGFKTMPVAAFFYKGSCAYGNDVTVRIVDTVDPVTNKVLFNFDVYNGSELERLPSIAGFNPEDALGSTTLFFETVINRTDTCIGAVASQYIDDFVKLIKDALALDDKTIEKFNYLGGDTSQALVFDPASADLSTANAIKLSNGSDGDLSNKGNIIKKLLRGEIIKDIFNPTRYRIRFLPDIGYATSNLADISFFLRERYGTVKAILSAGTTASYESAIAAYGTDFSKVALDDAILIPAAASPQVFNGYLKRQVTMPFTYFWFNAYLKKITVLGHPYDTFASSGSEISGFEPGTLECPTYTQNYLVGLYNARINVPVAKSDGEVTMYSQLMCVSDMGDPAELNNSMLMQEISYRVLDIIQTRNYKFLEADDLKKFQDAVQLEIVNGLKPYVTSITYNIYAGTGFDRETMYVELEVNCKNIVKRFKVSLKYVN